MSRKIGNIGEDLACEILRENGYKVISRNYFARCGEIDVVSSVGEEIVFVEVKYRKDEGFGTAIEAVTKQKLRRIYKSALFYLNENGLEDSDWRIDVIGINPLTSDYEIIKNVYIENNC